MQFQEALTFDDVLLKPAASAVLPNQTDTGTRLTRTVELRIPLMSSRQPGSSVYSPRAWCSTDWW